MAALQMTDRTVVGGCPANWQTAPPGFLLACHDDIALLATALHAPARLLRPRPQDEIRLQLLEVFEVSSVPHDECVYLSDPWASIQTC